MSTQIDKENEKCLYEGKVKKVFATDSHNTVRIQFTNRISAFNGVKKDEISSKDEITCSITSIIFQELEKQGIPTHYLKMLTNNEILATKLQMIPLEVVIRNRVAGSLVKRLGLHEGDVIHDGQGILELYYKNDAYGDPLITEEHVFLLKLLSSVVHLQKIKELSFQINTCLQDLFSRIGIILVDFKLEFGFAPDGSIVLGDEITPDTCRLWDMKTKQVFDKDVFRRDLGELKDSYQEVRRRLETLHVVPHRRETEQS